jgi:transcriptional regulator with XRE-family HTH domain
LTDPKNPRILVAHPRKGNAMARMSDIAVSGHRAWTCSVRLAARRHELGLTQAELADRLTHRGLPCTNRAVSRLEQGQAIDAGLLPVYAAVLDCTVTYLVGLTTDAHRWEPDGNPRGPEPPAPHTPDEHRVWILGPVDNTTADDTAVDSTTATTARTRSAESE